MFEAEPYELAARISRGLLERLRNLMYDLETIDRETRELLEVVEYLYAERKQDE